MRVRELMAKEVWTCRPDEALSAAARIMWDHDIGAVPVVCPDGRLVGIITDRDISMAAYFTGEPLASMPIGDHMSTQVFTVRTGESIESAEELMRSKQIRRLPVLDDAQAVVGMITVGDLARAVGRKERGVAAADVSLTLAGIAEGRAAVPTAA